ncbi:MAG TPA: ABC transporter permease [Dehalococcoidia bacterium]|jgi:peptide/nickel transport system permease protein|nr:ABC transporter permease [Dehalococcoidia bacterium]
MTAEGAVLAPPRGVPLWLRLPKGLLWFARRKPLGFFGLLIIVILVLLAIPQVAERVAPYSYTKQFLLDRLKGPSSRHLLGADSVGRDVLSRLIYGSRITVIVGFGAVAISETISAFIGLVSGYYGGWFDKLFQRIVDVFQALPALVVLIALLGLFGSGLWQMVIGIGLISGPPGSRLIRGQVLATVQRPFVEAARITGAGDLRIIVQHVLPNVAPLIIFSASVRIGAVILLEASLSFLGYGVPPPFPSWGAMLTLDGREFMRRQPGLAIYPGLAIALAVFSFNVLGDALRDVLDPRLKSGR